VREGGKRVLKPANFRVRVDKGTARQAPKVKKLGKRGGLGKKRTHVGVGNETKKKGKKKTQPMGSGIETGREKGKKKPGPPPNHTKCATGASGQCKTKKKRKEPAWEIRKRWGKTMGANQANVKTSERNLSNWQRKSIKEKGVKESRLKRKKSEKNN